MSYRAKLMLQWVFIIVIAFQFLVIGFSKMKGDMSALFLLWGYSTEFMYFIAIVEILSAIGLFFRKWRVGAGLAQIAIMTGAAYTHWMHNQPFEILINIGILGLCMIILWLEREKEQVPAEIRNTSQPY